MVGLDEELASHAYIYAVAKLHPPLASWGIAIAIVINIWMDRLLKRRPDQTHA
jgi:hypothetical protein